MVGIQMIAKSGECGCLSPGTAQVPIVNHKRAHGVDVVHTLPFCRGSTYASATNAGPSTYTCQTLE